MNDDDLSWLFGGAAAGLMLAFLFWLFIVLLFSLQYVGG